MSDLLIPVEYTGLAAFGAVMLFMVVVILFDLARDARRHWRQTGKTRTCKGIGDRDRP